MKHRGFEMQVIDALRERDLLERTMITTMHLESLRLIREHTRGDQARPDDPEGLA